MPRNRRIALAHYPHHIVQRGHNRKNLFRTEKHRVTGLDTLKDFREKLGLRCLMTRSGHPVSDKVVGLDLNLSQLSCPSSMVSIV